MLLCDKNLIKHKKQTMQDSKWFPTETLQEAITYLLFFGHTLGGKLTNNEFEEMFDEICAESETLAEKKHHANLRLLVDSPIAKIKQLATNKLRSMDLLTAGEQMEAIGMYVEELNQ
jgi:hypothetical protein